MLVGWRGDGLLRLHVVGDDDAGDRSLGQGDAHGAVDDVADLGRIVDHLEEGAGDVLEEGRQIDFLLVAAAPRHLRDIADDRDNRLVIEARVVEAIEQVDGAGSLGGEADADLAGELGMGAGHQAGVLFMAHLDEDGIIAGAIERTEDPVDAVTGIAVEALHTPRLQPPHQKITHRLRHGSAPIDDEGASTRGAVGPR